MGLVRIVLAMVVAVFSARGVEAQGTGLQVTLGPSYRVRTGAAGIDRHGGFDGASVALDWTRALDRRFGVLVGVGGYAGASVATEIDVPCQPTDLCAPPNPSPDGQVSGDLYHLRLGLSFGSRIVRAAIGGALGHARSGVEQWGAGGFGTLLVHPLPRMAALSVGVSGLVLSPAPGHTQAVITPTIGWRF